MLGASSVKDGVPKWQAAEAVENENDDIRTLGELPVYQSLGVTSFPAPKDDTGYAEAFVVEGVGGRSAFISGGRDTRTAKILGNKGEPGDTFVHATGSNQQTMVLLKGKKRSASVVVQDESGKHLVLVLDGKNKRFQVNVNGATVQIDKSGDVQIAGAGGAAITLEGGRIILNGELGIPGMPAGMFLLAGALAGVVGVSGVAVPVPGVGGFTFSELGAALAGFAISWLAWSVLRAVPRLAARIYANAELARLCAT